MDNTAAGGDYRVTAQGVSGPQGAYTVLVGAGQDQIDATLGTVAVLLAVGFPVIALIGGAATYGLVGRSLRPVERMRTQVSAISTADLSERVAVPAARDEISRLAQTMNAMLARIEAGHAAQRRFVGDASHELRSPLATVTTALELAATRPLVALRHVNRSSGAHKLLLTDGQIGLVYCKDQEVAIAGAIGRPWQPRPSKKPVADLPSFIEFADLAGSNTSPSSESSPDCRATDARCPPKPAD